MLGAVLGAVLGASWLPRRSRGQESAQTCRMGQRMWGARGGRRTADHRGAGTGEFLPSSGDTRACWPTEEAAATSIGSMIGSMASIISADDHSQCGGRRTGARRC